MHFTHKSNGPYNVHVMLRESKIESQIFILGRKYFHLCVTFPFLLSFSLYIYLFLCLFAFTLNTLDGIILFLVWDGPGVFYHSHFYDSFFLLYDFVCFVVVHVALVGIIAVGSGQNGKCLDCLPFFLVYCSIFRRHSLAVSLFPVLFYTIIVVVSLPGMLLKFHLTT